MGRPSKQAHKANYCEFRFWPIVSAMEREFSGCFLLQCGICECSGIINSHSALVGSIGCVFLSSLLVAGIAAERPIRSAYASSFCRALD